MIQFQYGYPATNTSGKAINCAPLALASLINEMALSIVFQHLKNGRGLNSSGFEFLNCIAKVSLIKFLINIDFHFRLCKIFYHIRMEILFPS